MLVAGPRDFNTRGRRVFALFFLLLYKFTLSVDSGVLRLNGTTGIRNGNTGTVHGNLQRDDPDFYLQNGDSDRRHSEMLLAFNGGGRSSHEQSKSSDGEHRGNSEEYVNAMLHVKEGSEGGVLQYAYHSKDNGGRLVTSRGDANSDDEINLPPSAAVWLSANATKTELGESEVQDRLRNASSLGRNGKFGDMAQQDDHIKFNRYGPDNSPNDKTQTGSEQQLKHETQQTVMNSPHVSTMVVRSIGDKEESRSEEHEPVSSGDMIIFPDEIVQFDEEKSGNNSEVETYFFIRAPLRNSTTTKCGANQKLFRGRCRTIHT